MSGNFILAIFATAAAVSAIGILIPVLPIYFLDITGSPAAMGFLIGITFFVAVLFRPISHYFLIKTGLKRAMVCGTFLFSAVIFCYFLFRAFVPIMLFRIIFGIAIVFFFVSVWSLIASIVPSERRSIALSIYTVSFLLPNFYAPWIGSRLTGYMPYFISGCLTVVSLIICLFIDDSKASFEDKHGFWKTLRHKDLCLPGLIMFSVIFADASVTVFLPIVALKRNIGSYTLFFTLFSVSTIITRLYFGRISTGANRSIFIIVGIFVAFLSFIAVGVAKTLFLVLLAGILYGIGFGLMDPNLYTIILEKRKDFSITQIMAGYGWFWDFGYAIGPLIMGLIYKRTGESGLYTAAAGAVFVGLIISFIYFRRGEHVEIQKQCTVR